MAAATAAAELCNGERLVVLLVIFRVLYSTPLSLFYEAAGICLLAAAGFLIEISADGSPAALQRFKTRSGASSGILLGAVTLPTVILSRLIQFSRALSGYDVKIEDLTYLRMQYWAVSISCLGVLIFLYLVLRSLSVNSSFFPLVRDRKFGLVYLILYTIICCMSLAAESSRGFVVAVKIFWLLSHGLASVGLIWHILRTFPSCASIGEALLVSSGIVLCFGDMMAYTLTKIDPFSFSSKSGYVLYEGKSEISTIIQGMSLSLLLLPALFKFVLQIWVLCSTSRKSEVTDGRRNRDISTSILFYSSFGFMLTIIAPSWMQLVQNFQMHPVLWVCNFVLTEPLKRLSLCFYWISIISLSVLRFYNISKHSKIERILLRKYYHLVAVVMFSPALLFQPKFLDLALGVAFAVFLVLEIIRIWRIWPLGHLIDQFMNAFTDHRDSDILIISHFSLLLGCALPKWMSFGFNDRPLAPFAGILSLGIGDTMASVVGHKYGTLRWSKSGKKTIEGTAAGITSVLVASSILLSLLASTGYILSQHWFSLLVAVTASGLLEAYTTQLDNAFIPLIFYSLLCL